MVVAQRCETACIRASAVTQRVAVEMSRLPLRAAGAEAGFDKPTAWTNHGRCRQQPWSR
jgi:hypothetical protein